MDFVKKDNNLRLEEALRGAGKLGMSFPALSMLLSAPSHRGRNTACGVALGQLLKSGSVYKLVTAGEPDGRWYIKECGPAGTLADCTGISPNIEGMIVSARKTQEIPTYMKGRESCIVSLSALPKFIGDAIYVIVTMTNNGEQTIPVVQGMNLLFTFGSDIEKMDPNQTAIRKVRLIGIVCANGSSYEVQVAENWTVIYEYKPK